MIYNITMQYLTILIILIITVIQTVRLNKMRQAIQHLDDMLAGAHKRLSKLESASVPTPKKTAKKTSKKKVSE